MSKPPLKDAIYWLKVRIKINSIHFDKHTYKENKLFILPSIIFSWDEQSVFGKRFAIIICFMKKYWRCNFGPVKEDLKLGDL